VTKSGSFFSYGDERLGQGRNNAKAFLDEHVEIAKEIESKIYSALGVDHDLVQPIDADGEAPPVAPDAGAPEAVAAIEQAA
jgi:recombination protein RecA